MASIFKRGGKSNRDGNYTISFINEHGDRQWKSSGTSDKKRAQETAEKWEKDALRRRQGIFTDDELRVEEANKKTIVEHVDDYITDMIHRELDPTHIKIRRSDLIRLIDGCKWKRVTEMSVTPADKFLRNYRANKGHGGRATKSARTINRHRQSFIAFANWLVKKNRIKANPFIGLSTLSEKSDKRRVARALSMDELNRLLNVAPERRDAYIVMMWTALRVRTLRTMKVSEYHPGETLGDGCLLIPASKMKSKVEQRQELHPECEEAIQRLIAGRDRSDTLIPRLPTLKRFKSDCKKAGIDLTDKAGQSVYRHGLRHTMATELLRRGNDPEMVKEVLGHNSVAMTKRYDRRDGRDRAKMLADLPPIFHPDSSAHHFAHHPNASQGQQEKSSGNKSRDEVQCDESIQSDQSGDLTAPTSAVEFSEPIGRLAQLASAHA